MQTDPLPKILLGVLRAKSAKQSNESANNVDQNWPKQSQDHEDYARSPGGHHGHLSRRTPGLMLRAKAALLCPAPAALPGRAQVQARALIRRRAPVWSGVERLSGALSFRINVNA
jgi:hypothetical protein